MNILNRPVTNNIIGAAKCFQVKPGNLILLRQYVNTSYFFNKPNQKFNNHLQKF